MMWLHRDGDYLGLSTNVSRYGVPWTKPLSGCGYSKRRGSKSPRTTNYTKCHHGSKPLPGAIIYEYSHCRALS